MNKKLSTLVKEVEAVQGRQAKIDKIREIGSVNKAFLMILQLAFDQNLRFLLPESDPPYTPCKFPGQEIMLYNSLRKMYVFLEGHSPQNLTPLRREYLFIEMLETLDPEDAELMVAVKNKTLNAKRITPKLVNEAVPGLLTSFSNVVDSNETEE